MRRWSKWRSLLEHSNETLNDTQNKRWMQCNEVVRSERKWFLETVCIVCFYVKFEWSHQSQIKYQYQQLILCVRIKNLTLGNFYCSTTERSDFSRNRSWPFPLLNIKNELNVHSYFVFVGFLWIFLSSCFWFCASHISHFSILYTYNNIFHILIAMLVIYYPFFSLVFFFYWN